MIQCRLLIEIYDTQERRSDPDSGLTVQFDSQSGNSVIEGRAGEKDLALISDLIDCVKDRIPR